MTSLANGLSDSGGEFLSFHMALVPLYHSCRFVLLYQSFICRIMMRVVIVLTPLFLQGCSMNRRWRCRAKLGWFEWTGSIHLRDAARCLLGHIRWLLCMGQLVKNHRSWYVTFLLQTVYLPHYVGKLLLKWLLIAIPQALHTRSDFKSFNESLHREMPAEVIKAEKDLVAWNDNKLCPDPYCIPKLSE